MYIKPKKSLGQNFLIDKNIRRKMLAACEFKPTDYVLEIGAGRGELTELIAPKVAGIWALEIDSYLCTILKDKLKGHSNTKIINQDILRFNFRRNFRVLKNKIKVVGNIPYYITTPIIERLLEFRDVIDTIFITVQKELAQRIIASAGSKEYSSFSCFVQYYTIQKVAFFVRKTCFSPVPKVDSCFLELKIRQIPAVKIKNEKLFFQIIRAAFNKRRKILKNSLKGILHLQKLSMFFKKYNINSNIRPENLTLQDFAHLTNL